jgi:oligopeptide/dipeptide ABC transporter ATP-binding protein
LLGSMPRIDRPRPRRLAAIPGAPPSLLAPPPGCRFAPRCPHRFELCSLRPSLTERVAPGRRDACHLDPSVRPALRLASLAVGTERESA